MGDSAGDAADEAAQDLYGMPPAGFVAARDERVKALKAAGDKAGAKQVAALHRPTVGAWLVNLLVLDDPDLPEQLATLAGELQAAQEQLAGDELKALGRQRQQLVSGLVGRARGLAREAGGKATDSSLVEVESTLRAALSDPDVAREVLSGRLRQAREVSGFGPAPSAAGGGTAGASRPARAAAPAGEDESDDEQDEADRVAERRRAATRKAADERLAKARRAAAAADERAATSGRRAERSAGKAAEAKALVERLRAEVETAESEAARARAAAEDTATAVTEAEQAAATARAELAAAEAAVADLQ